MKFKIGACLLVLASLAAIPVHGADDKKAGKDATKRLQQMLRKSEQEKNQLMQEKAATEGQLKEAGEKLDAAQRKAGGLSSRVSALTRELDGVKAERDALTEKLAEARKTLADTSEKLSAAESDNRGLRDVGARQKEAIALCGQRNVKLYEYGNELLGAYQGKGCASALMQAEPFTRLKRIEVENMVEDYRDKLDEQKFETENAAPSPVSAVR